MPAATAIQELAKVIEEACSRRVVEAPPQATGWAGIDEALGRGGLGGLARGVAHEWFSGDVDSLTPGFPKQAAWLPPLTVMVHLARQVALAGHAGPIVWIGRRCWPYPPVCGEAVLERSIFVDATSLNERAWAIDVSLRCPSLAAVIGDGTALNMSATRRLQLAAADGGALGLILRPPQDLRQLSAAHTRWSVAPSVALSAFPRWTIRLLRCKGVRLPEITTWTLELNHETGALDLVSDAADRSGSTPEIAGAATA